MITESIKKYINNKGNPIREYRIGSTLLYFKDLPPESIEVQKVVEFIKHIPQPILNTADAITVGNFDFLTARDVQALYNDGIIYISNNISSQQEILKNLVHEFAHGCEEVYYNYIYEDSQIKEEFLTKRKKMYQILVAHGFTLLTLDSYLNIEYDVQFDEYLYKNIGYAKLDTLLRGLFISPYAATSLREYFANGFEKYFLENPERVRETSPALYEKILLFQDS